MNNIYVEALYNENRNAIPSWQGYQYQAQAATYFFLKYILDKFNDNSNDIDDISMKIEWMEDFIIYENEIIKKIYQVKKTLNKVEYDDVLKNFIFQHKIIDDGECEWVVVFDEIDNQSLINIDEKEYETIYDSYVINVFLNEIIMLIENRDKPEFWIENLKKRYKDTQLPYTRYYVNNLLNSYNVKRIDLNKKECSVFVDRNLHLLRNKLTRSKDDFSKFKAQIKFENKKISNLDCESERIVNQLSTKQYFQKSDIMFDADIVKSLYILIYEKLMNIKSKKVDTLEITVEDIKEIFSGKNKAVLLWKEQVYKVRENMVKNIEVYCCECLEKKCNECVITDFLTLEFSEVIDSCNLEYPRFQPEKIAESLRSKLSPEKYNYLIDTMFTYKEKISCIEENNFIELKHNIGRMFVSQYIAEDRFSNKNLITNIPEHLDVYKEYSNILTKNFTYAVDYGDIKIVKDLEGRIPRIMDIPKINFKSKQCLEED